MSTRRTQQAQSNQNYMFVVTFTSNDILYWGHANGSYLELTNQL